MPFDVSRMRPLTTAGFVLIFLSTVLLVPGIFSTLANYKFHLEIFGNKLTIIDNHRSFKTLVHQMWDESAYVACFMLTFFGVVLPLAKLASFALWFLAGAVGETYIGALRGVSKWTAMDAVVEAMIIGMLLKIPNTEAYHGIGFTCFVAYCVISSFAYIFLPGEILCKETKPTSLHARAAEKLKSPRARTVTLVLTLGAFLIFLCIGGSLHCFRLWIPKDTLQEKVDRGLGVNPDNLPPGLRGLSEPAIRRIEQGIGAMPEVRSDVSLSGCIRRLVYSGHFYTVTGSCLLFFCVIMLPVIYAVLNTARALSLAELPDEDVKQLMEDSSADDSNVQWWPALDRLRTLAWDLSMIDVCVCALPLAVLAAESEKELKAELLPGFGWLLVAAAVWHFHNFCCRAVQLSIFQNDVPMEQIQRPEDDARPAASGIYI